LGRLEDFLVVIAPATDAVGARRLADRLGGVIRATPVESEGRQPVVRVRAAYCAADDFARSTLSVDQMLERAVSMLGHTRADAVSGESVPLRTLS
jgi:hypothetical protein